MKRLSAAILVLVAATTLACATRARLDMTRLPDSAVAVVYWTETEALERVDLLNDQNKRNLPQREGIARLETLDARYGGTTDAGRRLVGLDGRLALLDPRTGSVTPVADAPTQARPLDWSPDRNQLLIQGNWRGQRQLFVWDRHSGEVEIATPDSIEHPMGCLGPDGLLVAAELRMSGTRATVKLLQRRQGGAFEPLTDGPWDVQPACSPTGGHVAFATLGPDGAMHVAALELGSDAAPRLLARGQEPSFSPDGAWVVFAAPSSGGHRLWRVRAQGGGKAPIGIPTLDAERDPTVSPDGAYVAFVAEEETRQRLWVRRWDGSGRRPLLLQGDAAAPVW